MKKSILKFFPAALAMVALASCSADDVLETARNNELGKKSMIVEIEDPVMDLGNMRSSMHITNRGNERIFNTSDWLRAYDAQLQKYDRYQYAQDNNKFTSDDDNVLNPKYMLFPSDMVEYGTWKSETGLFALMKFAVYDGAEGKTDGHLSYAQESRTINGADVIAYTSNLPEFGMIDDLEDGQLINTKAVYLTGFLRIKIENGARNVKAIRVRSLNEDGSPNTKMPLWGYFDAILDGETTPVTYKTNKSKLVVSTEKLAKTYETSHPDRTTLIVDLTGEIKNYTSYVYIPIVPTSTTVDAENSEVRYPKLQVEYLEEGEGKTWEKNAKVITTFLNKEILSHQGYATKQKAQDSDPSEEMVINGYPLTSTATTLTTVNNYLADLDIDQKELTIDFTEQVASFVVTGGQGTAILGDYEDYTLEIPASWTGKYDKVTLNFNGKSGEANMVGLLTTSVSTDDFTWDVTDKDGTVHQKQKITLHKMVVENNSEAEIVINVSKGSSNKRDVAVDVTENKGTVTLGKNVYTISGKAGEIVVDATNSTAADVTVEATEGGDANVQVVGGTVKTLTNNGSGTVTVNGATVTKIDNNGGDVTVEENAIVNTLNNNGEGNVTVTGARVIGLVNGVKGGDITYTNITGRTDNISSLAAGRKFSFKNENKVVNTNLIHTIAVQAATVEIANVDIDTYLRFSAPLTSVSLENCEVASLLHNTTGKAIKLNTKGNTFIGEVKELKDGTLTAYGTIEKPFMTFESEWNGETTAPAVITKAVSATYDVYTAAELSQLLKATTGLPTLTVNLYADIKLDPENKNNKWTGIEAYRNVTGSKMFNGNDHEISNVNITTPANKNNWLSGTGFINNTGSSDKFTAKNLKLTGVNTTAIKNFENKIGGIGGFVGVQNNAGEYEGISVTGGFLGVETKGKYAEEKGAMHVGGLIGEINDVTAFNADNAVETTITACKVNVTKIQGRWNLGGLVGDARSEGYKVIGSVSLKMEKNTVKVEGFAVTLELTGNNDSHYGRVGMLLGAAGGGGEKSKLIFGTAADKTANDVTDCIVGHESELKFGLCVRVIEGPTTQTFVGKKVDDSIYVGYSPDFEGVETATVEGLKGVTKIYDFNNFDDWNPKAAPRR